MKPLPLGFDAAGRRLYHDERLSHQHVIGASGSGKSKFLEQMIRGDLGAQQGFCLIDPHGSLYDDIVRYCGHFVLNREIVLLNLSEPKHIVGFNFFSRAAGEGDVSVQVDNRISATLHAWGVENADSTPTLERVLRLVYTTLLEAELTLPQVAGLLDFSQKELRDQIIARLQNDLIRREWQELSDLPRAKDFRDEILSTKNRLFRLLTSRVLMRFLGVKDRTVDLYEAMNKGKIILVNLAQSAHLSRENARVFGSLLVNQFFEAALRRKKDQSAGFRRPKPYYLYLDEFQNFVSLDLCNMLDEVRKFGLFLILSHQRFGQLNDDIEDAILTNCRIKTVFGGLRVEDAEMMAKELFISKLDPLKIKIAIYQTKHWYKYTRDKVYSKSTTRGESEGHSFGEGSGFASGSSFADVSGTVSLPPLDDSFTGAMWFGPEVTSISESHSSSFSDMQSHSTFSGESYGTSWSESEGVADIPVFVPVPFDELSSVQYYPIEEQLLELTDALQTNEQRRCFIQLPGRETQPLLVPYVREFYVSNENLNRYVDALAAQNTALSPEEADRLISQDVRDLLQLQGKPPAKQNQSGKIKQTSQKKKSKNIFDKIKKANPDLDI